MKPVESFVSASCYGSKKIALSREQDHKRDLGAGNEAGAISNLLPQLFVGRIESVEAAGDNQKEIRSNQDTRPKRWKVGGCLSECQRPTRSVPEFANNRSDCRLGLENEVLRSCSGSISPDVGRYPLSEKRKVEEIHGCCDTDGQEDEFPVNLLHPR